MISLMRIDGRLIHGMVAVSWVGIEKPDILIVVNNKAASDEFEKMALSLAKPSGVRLIIWSKEEAVEKFKNPKLKSKKIFLVVGNFEDALFMCNNVEGIQRLNVGPTLSKDGGRETKGKVNFSEIWISYDDFLILKEIAKKGINIFAQISPTVGKTDFDVIQNTFEKEGVYDN